MPDASTAAFSIENPGKPDIQVTAGELDSVASQAESAIMAAGLSVFQRGRRLVRPATQEVPVSKGRTTTASCFAELSVHAILDVMARAARWTKYDGRAKEMRTIDPPRQVGEVLLSRYGEWRVRPVAGVITTPTLRPDYSVLCEPGYDDATRLYLALDPTLVLPPIPSNPTRARAESALALLDGLLDGFPFMSRVDRSVALSALLTAVCRGAMPVAPLHAFRASTAGTGKSYLADVASAIATGRPCPVASVSSKETETESRLVGLLLAGFPVISLDNINGELGSDLLCQAVERPTVRLRKLGASDIAEIETRATIFATGNALRVRGDMTRRTLICDLDAQMERPELRSFAFDPVDRVLADRGRYVAAAITLVRAFLVSGESLSMPELGSYGDYSGTVRGALVWLGYPDPALSMERARDDDPELGELRDLMAAWRRATSEWKTVKQMREIAEGDATGELNQALIAAAGGRHGIDAQRLGKWLRSRKGRIVTVRLDGDASPMTCRFVAESGGGGVMKWRIETIR